MTGVSRASFYRNWEQKAPHEAEMKLRDAIQRLALAHRSYGYRRIAPLLQNEGFVISAKQVRRIMREDNLLAIRRRKFKVTAKEDPEVAVHPNLASSMHLTGVGQLWVADLTYIWLRHEFVFLAVVLDGYSRKVVGWALGRQLDASLPLLALERALTNHPPPPGLVHHSDRGSQYASHRYVKQLEAAGATLSMSGPGRPWENGKCESFIKTLKYEQLNAQCFTSLSELEAAIAQFIEQYYNPVRLHSALGYRSPIDFERAKATPSSAPTASQRPTLSFLRHEEIYPHEL